MANLAATRIKSCESLLRSVQTQVLVPGDQSSRAGLYVVVVGEVLKFMGGTRKRPRCKPFGDADFGRLSHLLQQVPRRQKISGLEALGEPVINRSEDSFSFVLPILFYPHAGEAERRSQFPKKGLLFSS